MYKLFVILAIIASILLILIVLIQNPKGGFASNFINANQFGGVAQTNRFLVRSTWTLAITIFVFVILATITLPKRTTQTEESDLYTILQENAQSNVPPTIPVNPQTSQQTQTQSNNQ